MRTTSLPQHIKLLNWNIFFAKNRCLIATLIGGNSPLLTCEPLLTWCFSWSIKLKQLEFKEWGNFYPKIVLKIGGVELSTPISHIIFFYSEELSKDLPGLVYTKTKSSSICYMISWKNWSFKVTYNKSRTFWIKLLDNIFYVTYFWITFLDNSFWIKLTFSNLRLYENCSVEFQGRTFILSI